MNQPQSEYDSIAEAYKNSKQLSFRKYVEEYTLFAILGEIQGATVLDLACGEGFYTRKIKQAGAAKITGVDISAEMIQLAQKEERLRPVGCHYLHQNVAELALSASVDLVVAMYLLNYAQSKEELLRFVQVAYNHLRAGGRFVGCNDNVQMLPRGTISYAQYGLTKESAKDPQEGDPIVYTMTNEDGTQFSFNNFLSQSRDLSMGLSGKLASLRFNGSAPFCTHPNSMIPFGMTLWLVPRSLAFRATKP